LGSKTFDIWRDEKIDIPWHGSAGEKTRKLDITWTEKTEITLAELALMIKSTARTTYKLELNANEIFNEHWELWEDLQSRTRTNDVTSILRNGLNVFTATLLKDFFNAAQAIATFDLILTLGYEGEEPQPPRPWYEKYIPFTIGGAGMVVGGLGIKTALERREEGRERR